MSVLDRIIIEPAIHEHGEEEEINVFSYRSYEIVDWMMSGNFKIDDISDEYREFLLKFVKMYSDFADELNKKLIIKEIDG